MSRLVLIDGNAIMHRAFHALPPLTTRAGEPINAVYGLVSMLLKIVDDLAPTHIAFCFDRKEKTFRKKEFKEYQAKRPEMDEELASQFEKAQRVIKSFGIPVYSKAGFEADDVIGTIAKKVNVDGVVIVTGDRDILQLVDSRVKVFMPTKGLSVGKIYSEKEVVERLGVTPAQIVDYKALVGDPSDNYPGIPGIGPKTAESLIKEYGKFENICKNLDKFPERLKQKFQAGRHLGEVSYKLARIVTDVNVDFDINEMSRWDLGSQKALNIFSEFGFKTLARRIQKTEIPTKQVRIETEETQEQRELF